MSHLVDAYLEDVPPGSLIFPSTSARKSGHGDYCLKGPSGLQQRVKNDSDIFPAIVINPAAGVVLTPTGIQNLDHNSFVSVMKKDPIMGVEAPDRFVLSAIQKCLDGVE